MPGRKPTYSWEIGQPQQKTLGPPKPLAIRWMQPRFSSCSKFERQRCMS